MGDGISDLSKRGLPWGKTTFEPDWTLTPAESMAAKLTIALSKHIPGWPGATDEQLAAVAEEILKPQS
jgi:hypothetical protein